MSSIIAKKIEAKGEGEDLLPAGVAVGRGEVTPSQGCRAGTKLQSMTRMPLLQ